MKKNVLALSIATLIGGLGFAGSASAALSVAESGAGHILFVPYYSAQEGNISVFHLTNTDATNGKAVKVRFRGASNSDDVLDFQVFMSPGDVWAGIVSKNYITGVATLVTADNTCTVPTIEKAGKDFATDRLTRAGWTDADKANETLEGYVEILNMSDIPASDAAGTLYKAIKHVDGKAPCTEAVLDATAELDRTTGYTGATDSYKLSTNKTSGGTAVEDLLPPTGGLTGQWYIMNLDQNTTFSGVMPAVVSADTTPVTPGYKVLNVFSAQMDTPAELATADPLVAAGDLVAQKYDVPDLSTPYEFDTAGGQVITNAADAAKQAKALTDALLRTDVINQYATDVEMAAKTDWVLSMPTRRYTIAANYDDSTVNPSTGKVTFGATYKRVNAAVTGNLFSTAGNSELNDAGQICAAAASSSFWDREEQSTGKKPVFSPSSQTYKMCGEVAVLSFQEGTSAIGANLTRKNVAAPYTNGWGKVTFGNGTPGTGVPVVGAAFMKLTNPSVGNGIVANYGVTWAHSYKNN